MSGTQHSALGTREMDGEVGSNLMHGLSGGNMGQGWRFDQALWPCWVGRFIRERERALCLLSALLSPLVSGFLLVRVSVLLLVFTLLLVPHLSPERGRVQAL